MDWTDLYLRTETEQDLRAACPFLVDSEGDWLTAVPEWLLDVIGPIMKEPAIHDEEGNEVVPAVIDGRFHANLRCTMDVAALVPDEIRTNPATPGRVFAGDPPQAAPLPPVSMSVGAIWDRLSDEEWDALDAAMANEHARLSRLWRTPSHVVSEDDNLWTAIDKHLEGIVQRDRKSELLFA